MTTITSPPTTLDQLIPPQRLAEEIEAGWATRKQHPTLPLSILTYSRGCQYDRHWTEVTTRCRGLIVDDAGQIVARPFDKFFNVGEHGAGAINIGACRVGAGPHAESPAGRWPTNLVFVHSGGCRQVGERFVKGDARSGQEHGARPGHFLDIGSDSGDARPNGHLYGDQVVPVFECEPGCPVAELDRQSGVRTSGANPTRRTSDKFRAAYGDFKGETDCAPARGADSGGASRYFPVFRFGAKATPTERPRLEDGTSHPTPKNLELMRWLVRLVTRPGGTVLDPYAGSGSTLEACALEGFKSIGIEREADYAALCVARLTKPLQPSLFGLEGAA